MAPLLRFNMPPARRARRWPAPGGTGLARPATHAPGQPFELAAMYAFLDRPLVALDDGSRLLVGAMRGWVMAMQDRECPLARLAPAFARHGALGAALAFGRTMALLNRHGRQNLGFCQPRCPHVGEAEALILALVWLVGTGQTAALRRTLGLTVAEPAQGEVVLALAELSRALAMAGIHPVAAGPDRADC